MPTYNVTISYISYYGSGEKDEYFRTTVEAEGPLHAEWKAIDELRSDSSKANVYITSSGTYQVND